ADGTVYFGSNDMSFYALEARSGREKWRFKTGGNVRSSAAAAYGMVFFDSYDGYLYALNAKSGELKWRFDLLKESGDAGRRIKFYPGDDFTSSPVVENGVVYIGARNPVYCFFAVDAFSGNEKWSFSPPEVNFVRSSPVIAGDMVLFGSDYNKMYALDKHNGSLCWELATERPINYGAAVDENGIVYFACKDHACYAVDGGSGELIWKNTLTPADSVTWVSGFPALGDNGLLYIGVSGYSGEGFHRLYALDRKDGRVAWEFMPGGWVWSSAFYVKDTVYVGGGQSGNVYALDAATGGELWSYTTGGAVYSSPLVRDGVLYIGSADGYLYALE
ncbi:MAG: PQQ-binding-like beta-propeller repeat protein, partial [Spirochaetia bacterium]